MTGSASRLSPAMLAGLSAQAGAVPLSAHLVDKIEPDIPRLAPWPWRFGALALAAHLVLAAAILLAGRVHLPAAPPDPVTISLVSETTPQGADVPQPAPQPQPQAQPSPTPLPAAPLGPVADLPPPPPAPPAPKSQPLPKPKAQTARGGKIKADKMASVTVAVTHAAVPFADNEAPDYPQAAIRAGEQGVVRFRLYLSADGRVERFVMTQSSGYPDLDESVRAAALGWRYQPATRNGVAVPSVVRFHVQFVPH